MLLLHANNKTEVARMDEELVLKISNTKLVLWVRFLLPPQKK